MTADDLTVQIPYGTFAQFRLAGEGLNDDNLQADITQTQHNISVKGVVESSKFGLVTDTRFDLFVFEATEDYNCYIEATTMWTDHLQTQMCDFLGKKPEVVHS